MTFAWVIVFLCLGWTAFAYAGYPFVLAALRAVSPSRHERGENAHPTLSVIIAVHNGEREIGSKLDSTLALEYPVDVEVLVTSDGSTDRTNEIVATFADRGVRLVANEERRGKEAAQAAAIAAARGEILVFTDVGARLDSDALLQIVLPFADSTIGAVSSEDVVRSTGGEGLYVRYEMWLRRLESEVGTVVGVSGSAFAIRRSLCLPWPDHLASDFRSALEVNRRGFRAVSEPRARAHYSTVDDPKAEWVRKVRTVRRGLAVLSAYRELLLPRYGRTALSLWGHKVARFTTPFALLALLPASAVVAADGVLGATLFYGQVAAYALAGAGLASPRVHRYLPARVASFFVLVNASILVAWMHHLRGDPAVLWQPTRRQA